MNGEAKDLIDKIIAYAGLRYQQTSPAWRTMRWGNQKEEDERLRAAAAELLEEISKDIAHLTETEN